MCAATTMYYILSGSFGLDEVETVLIRLSLLIQTVHQLIRLTDGGEI